MLHKTVPKRLQHFFLYYLAALPEPIDVEDLGDLSVSSLRPLLHAQPMSKIIAEVVTEERTHSKWVVHDDLALVFSGSSRLGSHGCADEDAMLPIVRFVDKRNSLRAAASE